MRSLILMLGAYALYKIVQENSGPAGRQLTVPLQSPAATRKARAPARAKAG